MFRKVDSKVRKSIIVAFCAVAIIITGLAVSFAIGEPAVSDEGMPIAEAATSVQFDANNFTTQWNTMMNSTSENVYNVVLSGNVQAKQNLLNSSDTVYRFGTGANFSENGAFVVKAGKTVTIDLNGYEINGMRSSQRTDGALFINHGSLIIKDGNTNTSRNYTVSGTSYTIKGGVLTGGYNVGGGGAIVNDGTLTIQGGTLFNNRATENGGAIYSTGTLTISGGTIKMNRALGSTNETTGGGGIFATGNTTISGGTIDANMAESCSGGGAFLSGSGTFSISGGTFSNNTAYSGAGIAVKNSKSMSITGGTFTGNASDNYGGAMLTLGSGAVVINTATFSSNTATAKYSSDTWNGGGAMAVKGSGAVNLNGSVVTKNGTKTPSITFENNKAFIGGAIYVYNGTFTAQNAKSDASNNIVLNKTTYAVTFDDACISFTGNQSYSTQGYRKAAAVLYNAGRDVTLGRGVKIEGNGDLGTASIVLSNGGTTNYNGCLINKNLGTSLPDVSGQALAGLGGTCSVAYGTMKFSGGATVSNNFSYQGSFIGAKGNCTIELNDCNVFHNGYQNGDHSNTSDTDGNLFWDRFGNTQWKILKCYWAYNRASNWITYKESSTYYFGCSGVTGSWNEANIANKPISPVGVSKDSDVIFEYNTGARGVHGINGHTYIAAGTYRNNTSTLSMFYMGYYNSARTFVYGGQFLNNSSTGTSFKDTLDVDTNRAGGGVFHSWENSVSTQGRGQLFMYGGTMSGNTSATVGGAIYSEGYVEIYGGTIENNTAPKGGAIFCKSLKSSMVFDRHLTIGGNAIIRNNKATEKAGAIYVQDGVNFYLRGGTVSDNYVDKSGATIDNIGGIYCEGTMQIGISKSVTVTPVVKGNYIKGTTNIASNISNTKVALVTGRMDGSTGDLCFVSTGQLTSGFGANSNSNPQNYISSDRSGYSVSTVNNEVVIASGSAGSVSYAFQPVADGNMKYYNGNKQTLATGYNANNVVIQKIVRQRYTETSEGTLSTAAADLITLYQQGSIGTLADFVNGDAIVAPGAGVYTITVAPASGKTWMSPTGGNGGTAAVTITSTIRKKSDQRTNSGYQYYYTGTRFNQLDGFTQDNRGGMVKSWTITWSGTPSSSTYLVNVGTYYKYFTPVYNETNGEAGGFNYYTNTYSWYLQIMAVAANNSSMHYSVLNPTNVKYTGSQLTPAFTIYLGNDSSKTIGTFQNGTFTATSGSNYGTFAMTATWGTNKLPGKNAGSCTVKITSATNFSANSTMTFYFDIYPAQVPASDISGAASITLVKDYDGTTNVVASKNTLKYNGSLSLTLEGVYAYYDNASVGTNKTIYVVYEFGGSDNEMNGFTYTVTNGAINAINLSTKGDIGAYSNRAYSGSANSTVQTVKATVGGSQIELVEGQDFTASFSNSNGGAGNTTNVGTVTVTITGKGNYTGSKTTTFNITNADIIVNVTDNVFTYDNRAHSIQNGSVAAPSGKGKVGINITLVGSNTPTLKVYKGDNKPSNWASVTTSALEVTNVTDSATFWYYITANNHNAKEGSFVVTINRQVIETKPSLNTATLTYDKTAKTLVNGYDSNKMTMTLSYTAPGGSAANQTNPTVSYTNAGTYAYSILPGANYKWVDGTDAHRLTKVINQKALTAIVWAGDSGLTYSGAVQGPTASVTTTQGVVSGDTVNCTVNYLGRGNTTYAQTATKPKNAGTYTAKVVSISNSNYSLPATVTKDFEIAKKAISKVNGITASDKTYNGNTTATLNVGSITFEGIISGESLNITGQVGNFASANASADAITVSITGITLADKGDYKAANYTLSNSTASTTAKINFANISVNTAPTPYDAQYDGVSHSSIVSNGTVSLTTGSTSADTASIKWEYKLAEGSWSTTPPTLLNYTAEPVVVYYRISANNHNTTAGTTTVSAKVDRRDISAATSNVSIVTIADVDYTAAAQAIAPVVKFGETTLAKDTDYTVAYSHSNGVADDTTSVGTITVTVTGIGNFTKSITSTYDIKPVDISVTVGEGTSFTYNGATRTVAASDATIAANAVKIPVTATVTGENEITYKFMVSVAEPTDWSDATATLDFLNVDDSAKVWYLISADNHNDNVGSFDVEISKAQLVLGTPALKAPVPTIYAGQALGTFELDQTVSATFAAAAGLPNTVAGEWVWVDEEEIIEVSTTATTTLPTFSVTYKVKFVPSVTDNYIEADDADIDITVTQLFVTVYDRLVNYNTGAIDTLSTPKAYAVAYGSDFTVDMHEPTRILGFTPTLYGTVQGSVIDGIFSDEITETTPYEDITANTTLYVTYAPSTDTVYYVFHVKQRPNNNNEMVYATLEEIVATLAANGIYLNRWEEENGVQVWKEGNLTALNENLADVYLNSLNVSVYPRTGTTLTEATANRLTVYGYTFDTDSLTTTQLIKADGTTVLMPRYTRNDITVSWNGNGGMLAVGTRAATIKNGQKISQIENYPINPTRTGYTFLGWNTNKDSSTALDLTQPWTGYDDVILYAIWKPLTYNIKFSYADKTYKPNGGATAYDLQLLAQNHFANIGLTTELTVPYENEKITLNGTTRKLTEKPTFGGLNFVRWVYYTKTSNGSRATTPSTISVLSDALLTRAYTDPTDDYSITLYAVWEVAKYTVMFNNNGALLSKMITVDNFTSVSNYVSQVPAAPKRSGFTFTGWYITIGNTKYPVDFNRDYPLYVEDDLIYDKEDEDTREQLGYVDEDGHYCANDGTHIVRKEINGVYYLRAFALTGNVTLEAGWAPEKYKIKFETDTMGDSDNLLASLGIKVTSGNETTDYGVSWMTETYFGVTPGDRLVLTVTPNAGYRLASLTVNGADCESGIFSVGYGYESTGLEGAGFSGTIVIRASVSAVTYRITYSSLGGGHWVSGASAPSSFNVNTAESTALPNNIVERVGYTFAGWFDYTNTVTGRIMIIRDLFDRNNPVYKNVQLEARWTPTPQDVVLDKNDDNLTIAQWPTQDIGDRKNIYIFGDEEDHNTGDEVTLDIPLPEGYTLLGLALEPTGEVVYGAQIPTEENYTTMQVKYEIKPENNVLYCKWIGNDQLYVLINVSDNNYTYNPDAATDDTKALKLTAAPLTKYADTNIEAVVYDFTWKKYNTNTTQFDTIKTERLTNEKNPQSILYLRNMSESGTYRCELIVTVTTKYANGDIEIRRDYALNTSNKVGVVKPLGDYDRTVTINAAKVEGLSLRDETTVYDGAHKSDLVKVKYIQAGYLNEAATQLRLFDDSIVTITYSFKNAAGTSVAASNVINAGEYTVTATFNMPKDSNYLQIEPLEAALTITPKPIKNISYSTNLTVSSQFTKEYDGTSLKVIATSSDIEARDNSTAIIDLYDGENVDIGQYCATLAGISGTAKDNYYLDFDSIATEQLSHDYEIKAAARKELKGLGFTFVDDEGNAQHVAANGTANVTYNGNLHSIAVDLTGIEIPTDEHGNPEIVFNYSVGYAAAMIAYQDEASALIQIEGVTPGTSVVGVGGIAAGRYEVTVMFADSNPNYGQQAPITVTFIIKQATYEIDCTKKLTEDGDNFTDKQIWKKGGTEVRHAPVIYDSTQVAGGYNADEIDIKYTYEQDFRYAGSLTPEWVRKEMQDGDNYGFKDVGEYRITAKVEYIQDDVANNYLAIEPIVIFCSIIPADIDRLELRTIDGVPIPGDLIVGEYNKPLNYAQFSVWVIYEGTNGEETIYDTAYSIWDGDEIFTVFDHATEEGEFYVITFKYYSTELDYNVVVSPATYQFKDIAYDTPIHEGIITKQYTVDGYAPEATFKAIDVFGADKASDLTVLYSVKIKGEWSEYMTADEAKQIILDKGVYDVKLGYVHEDTNYVGTTPADMGYSLKVNITAQKVSELVWQYSTDEETWTEFTRSETSGLFELPFTGKEYFVRAIFASGNGDEMLTAVVSFDKVKVLSAGNYVFTASTETYSNYVIDTDNDANKFALTVTQEKVTATWYIDKGEGNLEEYDLAEMQLVYDGKNKFSKIVVKYVDINGEEHTLNVTAQEMINANDYTLTAVTTAADSDYDISGLTNTIRVFGLLIETATFEYKDGDEWKPIPAEGLPYIGVAYAFKAKYTVSEVEYEASAKADVGDGTVRNVGTYTLIVGNTANYYISATTSVTLHKVVISSLTVTAPTYNGKEQELGLSIVGLVGDDASSDIDDVITVTGVTKATTVIAGSDLNIIDVELKGTFAKNYTLTNTRYEWNIKPRVAEFTWNGENGSGVIELKYTGSAQRPTAKLSNVVAADNGQVTLSYDGSGVGTAARDDAYTARVTAVQINGRTSPNYTITGSTTASHAFYILKSDVEVENVQYTEYAIENTTYVNTPLRNDKLNGDAYILVNGRSIAVAGEFNFNAIPMDSDAVTLVNGAITTAGRKMVEYTFTPTDKSFGEKTGYLYLTVQSLQATALEVKTTSHSKTTYSDGEYFTSTYLDDGIEKNAFDLYVVYNNYYVDSTTGIAYGKKEAYGGDANYNIGTVAAETVALSSGGGEAKYTITVKAQIMVPSNDGNGEVSKKVEGSLDITVSKSKVESISLNNNSKPVYYVGETFDVSTITLSAKYEDESMPRTVNTNISVIAPTTAFTEAGTKPVTLMFGNKTLVINVTVKEQEDALISYAGRQIQYEGGRVISIPTATYNGVALPEGLAIGEDGKANADGIGIIANYTIKNFTAPNSSTSTSASQISALGTYMIQVTFTITSPRYKAHESMMATFEVTEEVALAELELMSGSTFGMLEKSDARVITKVVPGTNVTAVLGNFEETGGTIKVFNSSNKELAATATVGTGTAIVLYNDAGEEVDRVVIVVNGDLNGDGQVNATDKAYLNLCLAGKRTLDTAASLACDINGDANINATDKAYLNLSLAGKRDIALVDKK